LKGIQGKQNKAKKIIEMKESIYKDQNKNLTFKPEINKSCLLFRKSDQVNNQKYKKNTSLVSFYFLSLSKLILF